MKRLTKLDFINNCKRLFPKEDFDYSETVYVNERTPVKIKSEKYGIIIKSPHEIMKGRLNDAYYSEQRKNKQHEDFIKKEKLFIDEMSEKYKNAYSFENFIYKGWHEKSTITCSKHGDFSITPSNLYNGHGCPKCSHHHKYTNEEFIEKLKMIFGERYEYSKVNYVNNRTNVILSCPKHGDFKSIPHNLLYAKQGCPLCNMSRLENIMFQYLTDNKVNFVFQKKFNWLGKQSIDFYLPDSNIAIECQGEQHFRPVSFSSNKDNLKGSFSKIIERDLKKRELCKEKRIKLIYFLDKKYFVDKRTSTDISIYIGQTIVYEIKSISFFINN